MTGSLYNERFQREALLVSVAAGADRLGAGSQGPAVKAVQQALQDLGFPMKSWPGAGGRMFGGADGLYGSQTERAVQRFQKSAQIPATGTVDRATLRALDAAAPSAGRTAWEEGPRFFCPTPVADLPGEVRLVRLVLVLDEGRAWLFGPDGALRGIFACSAARGPTPTWPGLKVVTGQYDATTAEAEGLRQWDDPGAFGSRIIDLAWFDPGSPRPWPSAETLHGTRHPRTVGMEPIEGGLRTYDEDIVTIAAALSVGDLVVVLATVRDRAWNEGGRRPNPSPS